MNKIILSVAVSLCCLFSSFSGSNDEDILKMEKYIKNSVINSDYDKTIRPSVSVNILMNIALKQIIALDERNQVMTTASYLFISWHDSRLKWKSNETSDIKTISIKAKDIWLPDFYITNTAEQNGFISITDTNLVFIQSDGLVYLTLSLVGLRTRCLIKIKKFPFDSQMCPIKIGSWQQDRTRITFNTTKNYSSVSDFTENPVWNIVEASSFTVRSSSRFSVSEGNDFFFKLSIKRKPLYYITNNVFSCLVLNVVTLLMFFIPFQLQATLSISTFLSLGIISIRVSSDIPVQSSYLPLISLFFMMNLFFIFIAFGWFVTLDNIRVKKYVPQFLIKLMDISKKRIENIFKKSKKKKPQAASNSNKTDELEEFCDKKEIKQLEVDTNFYVSILNFIAFILMFLFISITYIYIMVQI